MDILVDFVVSTLVHNKTRHKLKLFLPCEKQMKSILRTLQFSQHTLMKYEYLCTSYQAAFIYTFTGLHHFLAQIVLDFCQICQI